ncbi:hypothetical protein [Kitasatospora sp. NPDC005748]|uniref:hypothetical protein n=1 Tax=Kitasatospora sp. NPDC005748 TaxID=3157063 RepID=UPI0033D4D7DE
METATNENAVWAYSNTGTLAHAMLKTAANGRLVAACRSTITREADARLHVAEDVSGRLCKSCETRWNAHLARVERSMQPLQPCESFEVYGAAPVEAAGEAETVVQPETTTTTRTIYRPQFSADGGHYWSNIMMLGETTASDARRECEYQATHGPKERIYRVLAETVTTTVETVPAAPETADDGPRYVVEPVRLGFAVVDTSTGKPEARMGSRYAANDMADRLNAEINA